MGDVNPFSPPEPLPQTASHRQLLILRRSLLAFALFGVYTLSYGPWVAIGSRYAFPGAHFIHDVFYGPLHFLSAHIPPYGYVTMELFWWGYGPV